MPLKAVLLHLSQRTSLKHPAKTGTEYFHVWSLCWYYEPEHALHPAVEAKREELPWSVTTGVRLPYFTDGKSNCYYLVMTKPRFNLSPTRIIKTKKPVSTMCPMETLIARREGKSHSPLYAAHSIIEVCSLFTPLLEWSWSLCYTFHLIRTNQESLIYTRINTAFTLRACSVKYFILQFHPHHLSEHPVTVCNLKPDGVN